MNPTRWINGALLGIILLLVALIANRFRTESPAAGTNQLPRVDRSLSTTTARGEPPPPSALNRLNVEQPETKSRNAMDNPEAPPQRQQRPGSAASPLERQATAFSSLGEDTETVAATAARSTSETSVYVPLTGRRTSFSRLSS